MLRVKAGAGDGLHDSTMALLHDAQLRGHGRATSCRGQRQSGACPGGRCQASDEVSHQPESGTPRDTWWLNL
jgi:hypothetical protein